LLIETSSAREEFSWRILTRLVRLLVLLYKLPLMASTQSASENAVSSKKSNLETSATTFSPNVPNPKL
jgi:hypothetical protein